MPTATITSKGQITLPKAVREHLHVAQGDRVEFVVEANGAVQVRRLGGSAGRLFGILRRPEGTPLTLAEMDEERGKALAEDDERIRRSWHPVEGEE
jgi:AbrB family looped-hinge helix DNA binding protein